MKKLLKNIAIDNEKYLIVGTSSGPDSMCLLHYLMTNTNKKIICAHVNHNIRKQSQLEQNYLKKYCRENNLIFELLVIDKYVENNFENEARKKRYQFYENLTKKYHCNYIFLAHHGDDQIETILMKITRGSNLEGYAGLKPITKINNYYIVRPLLNYTKQDILNYNQKHHITFFIDRTNKNTTYTRNRFRHNIIPLLKQEDPNIHLKFQKYSQMLLEHNDFLNFETKKILKETFINNHLDITNFLTYHKLIQKNIIFSILTKFYHNNSDIITNNHLENTINLIKNKKPNLSINLPQNLIIKKEYTKLRFQSKVSLNSPHLPYKYQLSQHNVIAHHQLDIITSSETDGNNICRLNTKKLALPLFIRNKKEGDFIETKNLNGKKKIKEIFIENKIPKDLRDNYPILVDNNDNIIWLPNLKKSKFTLKKEEKYDIIIKYCEKEENNE